MQSIAYWLTPFLVLYCLLTALLTCCLSCHTVVQTIELIATSSSVPVASVVFALLVYLAEMSCFLVCLSMSLLIMPWFAITWPFLSCSQISCSKILMFSQDISTPFPLSSKSYFSHAQGSNATPSWFPWLFYITATELLSLSVTTINLPAIAQSWSVACLHVAYLQLFRLHAWCAPGTDAARSTHTALWCSPHFVRIFFSSPFGWWTRLCIWFVWWFCIWAWWWR